MLEGRNFASFVSLYLYVPDEGSLLPKYRDCTTSNEIELYICIYIVVIDVGVFISLCDSEFHIHGVICMIVRHKENASGSATYSDFFVSY